MVEEEIHHSFVACVIRRRLRRVFLIGQTSSGGEDSPLKSEKSSVDKQGRDASAGGLATGIRRGFDVGFS